MCACVDDPNLFMSVSSDDVAGCVSHDTMSFNPCGYVLPGSMEVMTLNFCTRKRIHLMSQKVRTRVSHRNDVVLFFTYLIRQFYDQKEFVTSSEHKVWRLLEFPRA